MVVVDRTDEYAEAALVVAARAGELDAFATLYERHHPVVLRRCRRTLGNGEEAADAAQETFLRAWRGLAGMHDHERFAPWLRTIAANVCIDALRRRRRTIPVDDLDDRAAVDDGDDLAGALTANGSLTVALSRLSDRHREVLQLREYEGWSYERIADDQQLEVTAVKSLLWRARQALRREFLDVTSTEARLSVGGLLVALRDLPQHLARSVSGGARLVGVPWESTTSAGVAAATVAATAVAVPSLLLGVWPHDARPPGGPAPTTVRTVAAAPAPAELPPSTVHRRPARPSSGSRQGAVRGDGVTSSEIVAVPAPPTTAPPATEPPATEPPATVATSPTSVGPGAPTPSARPSPGPPTDRAARSRGADGRRPSAGPAGEGPSPASSPSGTSDPAPRSEPDAEGGSSSQQAPERVRGGPTDGRAATGGRPSRGPRRSS